MKKYIQVFICIAICIFFYSVSKSQVTIPYFGKQQLINGFSKAIIGETISYFSVYPKYAKEALLTRATDGKKIIAWETDPIPAETKGAYAYFTWIAAHSTGTSGGDRNFDLYINNVYVLTFITHPKQYPAFWTFGGKDSTRLVFEFKTKDGASDAHGMAYLRVPMAKYQKGKALELIVVGQNQNSNDWYMTFKYSFKEKIDFNPLPFLLRGTTPAKQPLRITVLHFGNPATLDLTINGITKKQFPVKNGFNVFEFPVNALKEKTRLNITATIGKLLQVAATVILKPVIYREIDLVHHAHTDIGYSDIQENIVKVHTENIKRALQLIEKTKNYPEGSRFIWNIESSWAVENFMHVATKKEKQDFITAVKKGQIVISATYANELTGLCTPEEMNWITEYSRSLRNSFHVPINTAMQSDVPGISWSMVSALAQNGIRYFSNGPNYVQNLPDKGDRIGSTLRELGDKAFWWKSSSGKDSILLWTCGKGYSSWHGFAEGAVKERGTEKIAEYIDELDSIQYPYFIVQWRYNIVSDNGPTDSSIPDFVRAWNQKYSSPKLVLANVTDMFQRFEKQYGKTIPVLSGDFTPYWEDGAYSTAKEEAQNRVMSEKLLSLINFAKQKNIPLNKDWLYKAKRNIVLFHEHTWGAWCSISSPDSSFTMHQWEYKKRFIDSANYFINKIQLSIIPNTVNPSQITVVNTLPWNRSGYVEIEYPASFKGNQLTDDKGNKIPVQKNTDGKLCFVASDVPAKGEKMYQFSTAKRPAHSFYSSLSYKIDTTTGAIKSLLNNNKEWVNNNSFKGLLQALYVKGLNPNNFSLSTFKKMEWMENGTVEKKLRITCSMEGTNEVIYEITQYNGLYYLLLSVIIDKKAIREKEGVHIAFPFAIPGATVRLSMGDSFIIPGKDQIPGSNKDFFSVQRWVDVSDDKDGVTISSPQGALFEVDKIINEERVNNGYKKWKDSVHSSPNIFLYAMNNYWHTNYKSDQEGKVRFDFYLYFHNTFNAEKENHFGYESTQPLIGYGEK